MTLLEILKNSMTLIGLPDDADTLEMWRPRLLLWCNEGLTDLCLSLRPWARETITLGPYGEIREKDLQHPCVKVLSVEHKGSSFPFFYGVGMGQILVPDLNTGDSADIIYRYMPGLLSEDTDEPDIPEALHSLLVTYIVGREKSHLDTEAQNIGLQDLSTYEQMKKWWSRNTPPPLFTRFYNMY